MQFCSQGPSCIAKFRIHNCHSGQSWISSGVWHLQFDSDKRILSSNFVLKTWFEGLIMSLFVQTEDMTDDKSLVCIFLHCLACSSLMTNEDATLYTVHHFQNKWSVTRKGKKNWSKVTSSSNVQLLLCNTKVTIFDPNASPVIYKSWKRIMQ